MNRVDEIKETIEHLSPEEFANLQEWYAQYETERWDREIEVDVAAGRLDALADEAIAAFRVGNYTEL